MKKTLRIGLSLCLYACSVLTAQQRKQPELADGLTLAGIGPVAIQQGTLSFAARPDTCLAVYRQAYVDLAAAHHNASLLETSLIGKVQREVSDAIDAVSAGDTEACGPQTLQGLRSLVDGYRARGLVLAAAEQAKRDRDRRVADLRRAIGEAAAQSERMRQRTLPDPVCCGETKTPYSPRDVPEGTSARQ